jgi:hypothetical protein
LALTTTRAPSVTGAGEASRMLRCTVASTDNVARRSRSVRKHTPWRRVSWATSASTQTAPSRSIQLPSSVETCRSGAGESADVCRAMRSP